MNSDFKDLLRALNDEKVEYLIVGGYAVGKHSEPRYTKDIDIWVKTSPENAQRVFSALSNFGAPLEGISASVFENPELIYQIGVEPNRIDVLMDVEGFDFDDCWTRRVESTFDAIKAVFISIDDLIKTKLHFARPQDLIDADNLKKKIELEPRIRDSID
jgi:hypothetical protein